MSYTNMAASLAILFAFLHVCTSTSEDILILQPFSPKSHVEAVLPIAKELALRGHKVVYVSAYGFNGNRPHNVTEIIYPHFKQKFNILFNIFADSVDSGWNYPILERYYYYHSELCRQFFGSNLLQNWKSEKRKFRIVIMDAGMNECLLPIWPHIGESAVVLITGTVNPQISDFLRIPTPYSYVPFTMTHHTDRMTLFQRVVNAGYYIILKGVNILTAQLLDANVIFPYFPDSKPYSENMKNVSLILANEDPVLSYPRPYLPNMVAIGGIQCRSPSPLREGKLKTFVDNSGEEGFILFSLGSIVKGKLISEKLKAVFIKTFARIKQRIVWKYETELEGLSDNVMITKWVPQQDLLGHPKIRAFVSHGGLQGLQEGIYNAVPLICIPMTTDQPHLAASVQARGIGIKLDKTSLTTDDLVAAIEKVTTDPTLQENVRFYSQIFRDRLEDPLEKAVYWIEYVLRFRGAPHLQSASTHLNFFQYFLLDIILFVFASISFITWIYWMGLKLVMKTVYSKLKKQLNYITFKIKTS